MCVGKRVDTLWNLRFSQQIRHLSVYNYLIVTLAKHHLSAFQVFHLIAFYACIYQHS